jgi:soluble lytic murein transglycosylase-like protein
MRMYGCNSQIIYEEIMRAKERNMDPVKVAIFIAKESEFNVFAVSPCGAVGLMQIASCNPEGYTFDIRQNIRFGIKYMKEQLDRFGTDDLMAAAYNAGPGAVQKYGGVPPYKETIKYISFYNQMLNDVNKVVVI